MRSKEKRETYMGQLSTNVTKFDVSFILKHYLNPRLWGKTWTIFKYGEYKIEIRVYAIFTYSRRINLELIMKKNKTSQRTTRDVYFNLETDNINDVANKNKIDGEVLRLIEGFERSHLIANMALYKEALIAEREHAKMVERLCNHYLDGLGIKDEKIRSAYIKDQKWEQGKDYTSEVLNLYTFKVVPELYLSYSLFADNQEKYKAYLGYVEKDKDVDLDALAKEVEENVSKIQAGEMDDTVELEEIEV